METKLQLHFHALTGVLPQGRQALLAGVWGRPRCRWGFAVMLKREIGRLWQLTLALMKQRGRCEAGRTQGEGFCGSHWGFSLPCCSCWSWGRVFGHFLVGRGCEGTFTEGSWDRFSNMGIIHSVRIAFVY